MSINETRPLRIGLSVSAKTSGGGYVFITNVVKALCRASPLAQVTVFLHGAAPFGEFPAEANVVRLAAPQSSIVGRLTRSHSLKKALRDHPCDVLMFAGTELNRAGRQPHVFWPLTVAPQESEAVGLLSHTPVSRLRWKLLDLQIQLSARNADAMVFSSAYARDLYRKRYRGLGAVPVEVIWPAPSLPMPAANRTETSSTGKRILFVSHLYPYKMVRELILGFGEAVRKLDDDVELVIAGSGPTGPYRRVVEQALDSSGVRDKVRLLGAVEAVALDALYRDADLFVFPSISENAGSYALIDAFRYGLPVMSSDRSSMPEICGDAALFFDPSDPSDLADRLVAFFSDAQMRDDYADLSKRHFSNFPSWEEIGEQLLVFLDLVTDAQTN